MNEQIVMSDSPEAAPAPHWRTPMKDKRTWAIEDHLCRQCGGRILRCVTGNGMTAGGNPVFRCADCGAAGSGMGPENLCWCGFGHKFNRSATAYRCVPYSILDTRPELLAAFRACGCDPKRGGDVGIVLERDLYARENTDAR
jgi:hypothetical protein